MILKLFQLKFFEKIAVKVSTVKEYKLPEIVES